MERDVHELTAPYALDALDREEREVFEAHLATCERCRAELAELGEAAAALAVAVEPAQPPPHLRERILAAAGSGGAVVPLRRRRVERALALVAVPACAAAVALAVWSVVLHGRVDRERAAHARAARAAAILADPRSVRIPLGGGRGSLVVAGNGGAVLATQLGRVGEGRTYEAWVVSAGTPRPAGLFRRGGVLLLSRPVPSGASVAVTVEPTGGSKRPTSTPILSVSSGRA